MLGALVFIQGDPTIAGSISFGLVALLLVVLTRGRLGYDRYLRDTNDRTEMK